MKKRLLFALSAAIFATSCDKDDNDHKWDLPEVYAYATVMKVEAEPTSDADADDTLNGDIYFQFDSEETFVVTENASIADLNKLTVGQRVITGVTLTKSTEETYDYTAKLYEIIGVMVGEHESVATEEASDAIADDELSMVATDMTLTHGYLNLLVYFESANIKDVNIYLVENTFDEPEETDENYLNLELRFDQGGDDEDADTLKYESYLSFDMETYREKLAGKDGILLRLNTNKSGITTVEVDSKDLFPTLEEE